MPIFLKQKPLQVIIEHFAKKVYKGISPKKYELIEGLRTIFLGFRLQLIK